VMVVLRPCQAKLSGLRCLTIIGTEGKLPRLSSTLPCVTNIADPNGGMQLYER